jgi:transcriptional regulator with XRE-family HTH domain
MAKSTKTHPVYLWRKSGGISQQALAAEIGCTQSFLSQIEAGERSPSLVMAARLKRATGLPFETFVKDAEVVQ